MYVPLCNNLSGRINMSMEVRRTPIQINITMTQMQLRVDASAANCKSNEFRESETGKLDAYNQADALSVC